MAVKGEGLSPETEENDETRVYPTFPYTDPNKQAAFQQARKDFPLRLQEAREDLQRRLGEFVDSIK